MKPQRGFTELVKENCYDGTLGCRYRIGYRPLIVETVTNYIFIIGHSELTFLISRFRPYQIQQGGEHFLNQLLEPAIEKSLNKKKGGFLGLFFITFLKTLMKPQVVSFVRIKKIN